jgi:hypothetical protein
MTRILSRVSAAWFAGTARIWVFMVFLNLNYLDNARIPQNANMSIPFCNYFLSLRPFVFWVKPLFPFFVVGGGVCSFVH